MIDSPFLLYKITHLIFWALLTTNHCTSVNFQEALLQVLQIKSLEYVGQVLLQE